MVLVLAVVAGLYFQHALDYFLARAQADDAQTVVQNLVHQNAALRGEQRSLRDPKTIEHDARLLGMVKPGERPYVITGLPKQ